MTSVSSKRITTITVGNKVVDIYDSGIKSNERYENKLNLSGIITVYKVPSIRYYYKSKQGNKIPYIALSKDEDQMSESIKAWSDLNIRTIYKIATVQSSEVSVDLTNSLNGISIFKDYIQTAYRQSFEQLFPQDFPFAISNTFIYMMFNYPHNPSTNYLKAAQLSQTGTIQQIQTYFDEIGVITIQGKDIINLRPLDKYFYMTRLYGPPEIGNLNVRYIGKAYEIVSKTKEARKIAMTIPDNFESFKTYQSKTRELFYIYNKDPDSEIYKKMGAISKEAFFHNIFDYLKLEDSPKILPSLTLITIKNLVSFGGISTFLNNYTDKKIIDLIGNISYNSRQDLVEKASDILTNARVYLLTKQESSLCKNKEDTILLEEFKDMDNEFMGIGSLVGGLRCISLESFFDSLKSGKTTDGDYTFKDPSFQDIVGEGNRPELTLETLKDIKDAIFTGRYKVKDQYKDDIEFFINQFELQQSEDYQTLKLFQKWANKSSKNKSAFKSVLINYFQTGMYMRQWKGPGNPYPLSKSQTGQTSPDLERAPQKVQENVDKSLEVYNNALSKLPKNIQSKFGNLKIYKYVNGKSVSSGSKIKRRYEDVVSGRYCIRMASAPWAYTGAYYLKRLLNESIPGFNLTYGLEFIY